MRTRSLPAALAALMLLAPVGASADLLSKNYTYQADTPLEVGLTTQDGVRLDTVRFTLPEHADRAGCSAEVSISNTAAETRRVGVAVALYDAGGRLVGVASGGSRWMPLKASRARTYKLAIDDVNAFAHQAATFQISVESWP